MDTNLFEYSHKTVGVLTVCAVDSANQICIVRQRGHEQARAEETGDVWDCQELFYIRHRKLAGFRVRLDIEQEQAQRQAPLFGTLKFETRGDFAIDALYDHDVRTVTEELGNFFPTPLDTGRPIEMERLHPSVLQ